MGILEVLGIIFLILLMVGLSPYWVPAVALGGMMTVTFALYLLPIILVIIGIILIFTSGLLGLALLILGILLFFPWYK